MGKKKKAEPEKKQERALTPVEKQAVDSLRANKPKGRELFRVSKNKDGKEFFDAILKEELPQRDRFDEYHSHIASASGFSDYMEGLQLIGKACIATIKNPDDSKKLVEGMNRMATAMRAFEPRDEIEGQLVAQLVVLHEHSMYWLGRAMQTERVDFANTYLNASTKLVNRHHETIKALTRYRQGGDQKVIVENVHVNQGGQAIVGNVTGGGANHQKQGSTP